MKGTVVGWRVAWRSFDHVKAASQRLYGVRDAPATLVRSPRPYLQVTGVTEMVQEKRHQQSTVV